MTVTKKARKEFLKSKLSENSAWAQAALLKVFEFQTAEEQKIEHTKVINGIGFSGFDGEFLTSLAKQYKRRGSLSARQVEILKAKMPRYWKQVLMVSDIEKLDSLILRCQS